MVFRALIAIVFPDLTADSLKMLGYGFLCWEDKTL
jgi:hypothetical protein